MLLREPFAGGMTPALYDSLSDEQIRDSYLAPRDDKGYLIPLWKRREPPDGSPTGLPERAGRELPSREALEVPEEVFFQGVPQAYVLLFWSVYRGRGLSTEQTLEKWREHLQTYRPRQQIAASSQ